MSTVKIFFDGSSFTKKDSEDTPLTLLQLAPGDLLQLDWFSGSGSAFLPDDYVWWFDYAGRRPIQSGDITGDITGNFSTENDSSVTDGTITIASESVDDAPETAQLIISNTETGARHALDIVIVDETPDTPDRSRFNSKWTGTDGQDQFTLGQTTQDVEIRGGSGDDAIATGSEDDVINTGSGHDFALSGAGDDTLKGGTGNNLLNGGDGDDVLHGGAGLDILDGGTGRDEMTGGDDSDIFLLRDPVSQTDMADIITDFNAEDSLALADPAITEIWYKKGVDTIIYGDNAGTLIYAILSDYEADITVADFVLSGITHITEIQ